MLLSVRPSAQYHRHRAHRFDLIHQRLCIVSPISVLPGRDDELECVNRRVTHEVEFGSQSNSAASKSVAAWLRLLTRSARIRSSRCSIGHHPLQVGVLECLEDGLSAPGPIPSTPTHERGVWLAKAFGKIAPGSASWGDLEHGVEEASVVVGACTGGVIASGQQRFKACPLGIGEFVSSHGRFYASARTLIVIVL